MKENLKNNPKMMNKMALCTYLSIITLNVNGLNAPIKRHRVAEWVQSKTHIYAIYKRHNSNLKIHIESEQMGKSIPCKWK